MDFYRRAYSGTPFKEGESIIDILPPNFQHGPKVMVMERPRPHTRRPEPFLRVDYAKVELRVMSSLPELSEADLELARKMRPFVQEQMDFAVKKRLGLKPDAIDVDFVVVDDPLMREVPNE